jgi:hypothetical protein
MREGRLLPGLSLVAYLIAGLLILLVIWGGIDHFEA